MTNKKKNQMANESESEHLLRSHSYDEVKGLRNGQPKLNYRTGNSNKQYDNAR